MQGGRRVGAAAAEAATDRHALVDPDVGTKGGRRCRLQEACGTHHQIILRGDAGIVAVARDEAIRAQTNMHGVTPVEQLEHGLQKVQPVGPAAGDSEEQVELGRRRPGTPGGVGSTRCHGMSHRWTASRTL